MMYSLQACNVCQLEQHGWAWNLASSWESVEGLRVSEGGGDIKCMTS
jgi:hypothetical protein